MPADETPPSPAPAAASRARARLVGFLVALLAAGLFAHRVAKIRASLPYSLHFDEKHLTENAREIMQTGDWNPHWFQYPSLPIYLTTGGMSAGLLRSAGMRRSHRVEQIGHVSAPYYDDAEVVFPARALFALLGSLTILLAGGVAWRLSGSAAAALVAPLLVAISPLADFQSWAYCNVDVVGTLLALLAVWFSLRPRDEAGRLTRDGWTAGALAGLTISSKYSLFLVALPGLLRIVSHHRGRRTAPIAAFLAAMCAAFAATTPGLFDLPAFLDGLAHEVRHYATGHGNATIEPGLPHLLAFGRDLSTNLGWGACALALVGVATAFRRDGTRAVLTIAFPLALLFYLSSQRVHFPRNTLAMLPFVAAFAALGATSVGAALARTPPLRSRPRGPAIAVAAAALALLALAPWPAVARQLRVTTDSRTLAAEWIRENVEPGRTVFVPEELEMDTRSLTEWRVETFSLFGESTPRTLKAIEWTKGAYAILPRPLPEAWAALAPIKPLVRLGGLEMRSSLPSAKRGVRKRSLLRPGGNPTIRIIQAR